MQVTLAQAASMIAKCIRARLVPMLHGSPGVGKSAIGHMVAKMYNLKVIDLRLSQCDPTDLLGFPTIVNGRADYMPPAHFPLEGDPLPTYVDADGVTHEYAGWMLFLDELNSAPQAVQAAGYKLILDRGVGQKHLHKKVAIIGAGNLETDNAIVHPMSTALQSRLVHIEIKNELKGFLDWAAEVHLDHRITSYLNWKPDNLYAFSPDHTDFTYACNRTWEFAHRLLQVSDINDPDTLPLLSGTLSEGVAREFLTFLQIHANLPKLSDIMTAPETVPVSGEPSILWALTGALSNAAKADNIAQLLKYIKRMPAEFQVVCLKDMVRRHKPLMAEPAMAKWISESAEELF